MRAKKTRRHSSCWPGRGSGGTERAERAEGALLPMEGGGSGAGKRGHRSCEHTHGAARQTLGEAGGERGGEEAVLGRPRSAPLGSARPRNESGRPALRGPSASGRAGRGAVLVGAEEEVVGKENRVPFCQYWLPPRALVAALSHEHNWFITFVFQTWRCLFSSATTPPQP